MHPLTIGLIVNPLAGIGGRVGLKGSDGAATVRAALERGAVSEATVRAARALRALGGAPVRLLTGAGPLGEESCRLAGIPYAIAASGPWSGEAADTSRLAAALMLQRPDLLLFAGGDGTARLVAQAAGETPILGIPAGVKMYSAVFAATPAAAGRAAAEYAGLARRSREADILDLDEDARRAGHAAQRLFAVARTPDSPSVQAAKASPAAGDEADLAALAAALARELAQGFAVLGPGSTLMQVKRAMSLGGSLLGVDAAVAGRLVARDAGEAELLALAAQLGPPRIVVGVLGGSGALFGRGNQPIGPALLRAAGRPRITVIGGAAKLAALGHLFVDTGDEALDAALAGYWRVRTGARRETVMRVSASEA